MGESGHGRRYSQRDEEAGPPTRCEEYGRSDEAAQKRKRRRGGRLPLPEGDREDGRQEGRGGWNQIHGRGRRIQEESRCFAGRSSRFPGEAVRAVEGEREER